LIDAATGDCHALDPPDFPPGLPYPQPRNEPIRFRAEVMEPGEDFDQTASSCPRHRKSPRWMPVRANWSGTTIPSPMPLTTSQCSGARAAGRPRQTTTSFNPTQRNHFEASLLDSERPEVRLFAS
jgi:hypothetical protein